MYNSLYVILILIIIIDHIYARSSNPSHCLKHLRHHQPSVGHHLLRIEHSINNEQTCEYRCSIDPSCSMATFNRQFHRCHLFKKNPKQSISKAYRSNYMFSTFANCPERFSLSNIRQTRASNIHCNYDSLPWQRTQRSRSIIFKSYTLIGISSLPCQELCSSVRYCAGVQYQTRGSQLNRCRLLRSAKSWDLEPSKTWTIFTKQSCHVQINQHQDNQPLCNFKYFGEGQHKHYREIIHKVPRISKIQCQSLCSKMVHCIGIEFIERQSQCILLSPNFLQNDGSIDIKHQHRHHIYMKISCSASTLETNILKCSLDDIHCGCHQNPCQHGTCLSYQREGYHYMFCKCYDGFTGHLCNQQIDNLCPCLNGGTCHNDYSECRCLNGYYGDFCQMISNKI